MKSKILIIIVYFICSNILFAENIYIESKNIFLDKEKEISIFKENIFVKTSNNTEITSNYAEYKKKTGLLVLKDNVEVVDQNNNILRTNHAEFDDNKKILKSFGPTEIITTEKYKIVGENIILNDISKDVSSDSKSIITDNDNNQIFLENFQYNTNNNIFKSIGFIKVRDIKNNEYEFSQIYIDTKKKEILGTDIKSYFKDESLKTNSNNKPRIFANTLQIKEGNKTFKKGVFTTCDYRDGKKCPPWTIQASQMIHNERTKTIYYNNAVIKIYNIPIFFTPRLAHPDPSVKRRSGFLPPKLSDSKNLGAGISLPFFWAVNKDKNLTLTSELFVNEHPLISSEYQQAFANSNLYIDTGYTKGYKRSNNAKASGDKSHFFTKYIKNFKGRNASENSLSIETQTVSNDKYLKLYKINSNLVDYNSDVLKNTVNFNHENDSIFLGMNANIFETLNEDYIDKYEYVLPEITLDKNLFRDEKLGILDLQTNYKIHNYDKNKYTNFLVNDFNWGLNEHSYGSGLQGKILGHFRNINYETKNVDLYKKDYTTEIYGAIGYLANFNLEKKINETMYKLKPKMFFRYAPGSMRKETSSAKLSPDSAFNIDRLNNIQNFEAGVSSTFGFDYEVKKNNSNFNFSVAQVLNQKENKKMASKSSMDEKLSDLVGSSKYKINDKIELTHNFSLDQNYNDINSNEIGTALNFNPLKINFDYLQESKHIGDKEYISSKLEYSLDENGLFAFEAKRNLITQSAEFYNLSYEYMNDCLRAGLVYRREFYKDSELEPEDSLMFKITLIPFGNVNSPSFKQ